MLGIPLGKRRCGFSSKTDIALYPLRTAGVDVGFASLVRTLTPAARCPSSQSLLDNSEVRSNYRQAVRHDLLMLIQTRLLALCSQSGGVSHPAICSRTACVSLVTSRGGGESTGQVLARLLFAGASPATNEPHESRNDLRPSMCRLPLSVTAHPKARQTLDSRWRLYWRASPAVNCGRPRYLPNVDLRRR